MRIGSDVSAVSDDCMASLDKSLSVGLAIGIGWFLGNVLLRDASVEAALPGEGVAVAGGVIAFLVGIVVTFLFR